MALSLIYADGFDDYTTPDRWWPDSGTATLGATGRNGNGCRLSASNNTQHMTKRVVLTAITGGGHFMFAYRPSVSSPTNRIGVLHVRSGSADVMTITQTTSGQLAFRRGDEDSTAIVISGAVITANAWHHIEVEFTMNATTGRLRAFLNHDPTPIVDFTGNTFTTGWTTIRLGLVGANFQTANLDYDDFAIWDNGGTLNGQLGDWKVESLLPSGNGNASQLTGSDGNSTDNYLLVDDPAPDDDTTYVEGSTATNRDTYAFGNLTTASGSVKGIIVGWRARKTDANARAIAPVIRHSSSDNNGSTQYLSHSYLPFWQPYDVHPGTGVAFTIGDVNGDEYGPRIAV